MPKKITTTLTIIAGLSILLTGCTTAAPTEPNPIPTETSTSPQEDYVPLTLGLSKEEATQLLESRGFKVEYLQDDTKPANTEWVVQDQSIEDKVKTPLGTVITLTLFDKNEYLTPEPGEDPTVTTLGLGPIRAGDTCVTYGLTQYPKGFEVIWESGNIKTEIKGTEIETRYIVDIHTEYDDIKVIERSQMSCTVTGTDAKPQITNFEITKVSAK